MYVLVSVLSRKMMGKPLLSKKDQKKTAFKLWSIALKR